MTLDESQWHVRWFRWNQMVLDRWTGSEGHRRTSTMRGTDLCTYMRTIMLGSLLAVASVAWWLWMCVFLLMPFWFFGLASTGMVIGIVIGVYALFIGLLWLLIDGVPKARDWAASKLHNDDKPGFTSCAWQWLRAAKQRVCPLITFKAES